MEWQTVTSIVSLFAAMVAIMGLVYNLGKMNAKIEILWEAYKEEGREGTRGRGVMDKSSEWHLTEKGKQLILPELKGSIKSCMGNRSGFITKILRRGNPMETWEVIEKLGGVPRLSVEAEKVGVPLKEFIVVVETYIRRHLDEE